MSPFTHADKIKKPLLLIHGEADNNTGEAHHLPAVGASCRCSAGPKVSLPAPLLLCMHPPPRIAVASQVRNHPPSRPLGTRTLPTQAEQFFQPMERHDGRMYSSPPPLRTPPLLFFRAAAGTFPMQSERFYQALKGHGGTSRLVLLPHESHGYAGEHHTPRLAPTVAAALPNGCLDRS